jgi:hypothetical protein
MSDKINRWQWLGRVMLDFRLSSSIKVVAYWLAEHANRETMLAFPSVGTLVSLTGLSKRQVQRFRAALVRRGWIRKARRPAGLKGGASYILQFRAEPISPRHIGIKAAERMYDVKVGVTRETSRGDIRDAAGAIGGTPTGVMPDIQTSESKHHNVTSASSSDDGDADDEKAIQVVKEFKKLVHVNYGDKVRPFKPDAFLRQEAKFWLRAGFSRLDLIWTLKAHVAKMWDNKNKSPTCISALKHSLEDALNTIKGIRDDRLAQG